MDKKIIKKILLLSIGCAAVVLALIGVWVPGLPTTPFLLLALWAFAGSNKKLHNWLSNVPIFRSAMKHVKEFEEYKAVKREIKIISQTFAWGSFLFMLLVNGLSSVTFTVFIAAILCSIAMYLIPTLREKE